MTLADKIGLLVLIVFDLLMLFIGYVTPRHEAAMIYRAMGSKSVQDKIMHQLVPLGGHVDSGTQLLPKAAGSPVEYYVAILLHRKALFEAVLPGLPHSAAQHRAQKQLLNDQAFMTGLGDQLITRVLHQFWVYFIAQLATIFIFTVWAELMAVKYGMRFFLIAGFVIGLLSIAVPVLIMAHRLAGLRQPLLIDDYEAEFNTAVGYVDGRLEQNLRKLRFINEYKAQAYPDEVHHLLVDISAKQRLLALLRFQGQGNSADFASIPVNAVIRHCAPLDLVPAVSALSVASRWVEDDSDSHTQPADDTQAQAIAALSALSLQLTGAIDDTTKVLAVKQKSQLAIINLDLTEKN